MLNHRTNYHELLVGFMYDFHTLNLFIYFHELLVSHSGFSEFYFASLCKYASLVCPCN